MRFTVRLVLVLSLASLAWADPPGVRTSRENGRYLPLPKEEGVFHFVIYGDRTTGPPQGLKVLAQAVRETNLLAPDLVLTVGDLVGGYNQTPEWLEQMHAFRKVMDDLSMPWFPVAGNHDVYWGGSPPPAGHHEADFERHFGPLWYWFGHKNAAFVVLYSDEGDRKRNRKGWQDASVNRMGPEQLGWLEASLEEMKAYEHVFLFLHHPRWIEDYYPGSNWDDVHALLKEAGNVTAVFAGHIHRQRYDGQRDGIAYFALATTGGAIPFVAPGTGYLHHVNLVTVRGSGISVATLPVGTVLDPRDMTPERLRDVDLLRSASPFVDGESLALEPDGAAEGRYQFVLQNPSRRIVHVTAEIESRDASWRFLPDHVHVDLSAGGQQEVEVAYVRQPENGFAGLEFPALTLNVDYLAPTSRVTLPPRTLPLACRLTSVPPKAPSEEGNHVLDLVGANACAIVPSEVLDVPDGPFTVEGWINASTYKGRRAFLAKTERAEYGIFVSDGKPSFSVFLGGRYVSVTTASPRLEAGRWHHLAGVYDGHEVRLYVDGELAGVARGEGRRKRNPWAFLVGADPDRHGRPNSAIHGRIDEVRVSQGARYEGKAFEPARRFEPDDDTLLLLHLDRSVGPFVVDASAGERHGRAHGKVAYQREELAPER